MLASKRTALKLRMSQIFFFSFFAAVTISEILLEVFGWVNFDVPQLVASI